MAETTKKTAAPSATEVRAQALAGIGLTVGGRYKTVRDTGGGYLGNVKLTTIVGEGDLTALVFQTDGEKDAPFQVMLLRALASFTLAK